MSEWRLRAQAGGLSGPNYEVLRNGLGTGIIVYDLTGSSPTAKAEDFADFRKRLESSKFEVLREPDLLGFEVGKVEPEGDEMYYDQKLRQQERDYEE